MHQCAQSCASLHPLLIHAEEFGQHSKWSPKTTSADKGLWRCCTQRNVHAQGTSPKNEGQNHKTSSQCSTDLSHMGQRPIHLLTHMTGTAYMPLGKAASLPGFGQDAWDSHTKGSSSSVWWSVLTECGCCWTGHQPSLLLLRALCPLVTLPSLPSPKSSKNQDLLQ